MILWKDFVLDDQVGPLLRFTEDALECRRTRLGSPSVMDDAMVSIQETGQEQRPARMVGLPALDSQKSSMEAGVGDRVQVLRRKGERQ